MAIMHGRDFHRLADHMTKGEIREFSARPFSVDLMFNIVGLMISQKLHVKVAQTG